MSVVIREQSLEQLLRTRNFEGIFDSKLGAVVGGSLGFAMSFGSSLAIIEGLRQSFGLGGGFVGYFLMTPCMTLGGTCLGMALGDATQKIGTAAFASLWRG